MIIKQKSPVWWKTLALLCCVASSGSAAQFGNFIYEVVGGTSITITGYDAAAEPVGDIVIPETIEDKPVTSIGNNAFFNRDTLTGVTIPGSVTTIGASAFRNCDGLEDLTIPASGLISIGNAAFSACSLTGFTIPGSVTTIVSSAFQYCNNLSSLTIPSGVTSIGAFAFRSCSSMTAITVDPLNPNYSSADGLLYDKNQNILMQCPGGKVGSVTVPATVTSIDSYAFNGCNNVTDVTIGNGITSIQNETFAGCSSLTDFAIPGTVTSIGAGAFRYCVNLENLTIPSSVTSIGYESFTNCSSLANLVIPESVTSIDGYAFFACTSLTSVAIPDGVTTISGSAFSSCSGLTSVTIPEGVTTIGTSAFSSCSSLTSVTIPASVTSIGGSAFRFCGNLVSACFIGNAPTMGFSVFDSAAGGFKVYFFDGMTGFTEPTWMGYPSVNMGAPSAIAPWLLSNGFAYDEDLQADPNDDGVNLLMAYALNLDPREILSGSLPLPVIAAEQMSLTFFAGSDGVSYAVKASTDLQNWSADGVTLSAPDANNFRTATINLSSPAAFMRIEVVY